MSDDILIELTGIVISPYQQLHSLRIRLFAVNVLLTFDLPKVERSKQLGEKQRLENEIAAVELEIQELNNPSQLSLL